MHTYVCVCTYVFIRVSVCMYVCAYVFVCMFINMYVCMNTPAHIHINIYMECSSSISENSHPFLSHY